MKKVRVLKEMPFVRLGHIFEIQDNETINVWIDDLHNQSLNKVCVKRLIKDGWLEEVVEEKSLAEKMADDFNKNGSVEELAKIAMLHAVQVYERGGIEAIKKEAE